MLGDELLVGLVDSEEVVEVVNVANLGVEKFIKLWGNLSPDHQVAITHGERGSYIGAGQLDVRTESGKQRVRDLNQNL